MMNYFKNPNLNDKMQDPLFIQLEGSIWEIFQRFKKRVVKIKKENNEEDKHNDQNDESSWIASSDESVSSFDSIVTESFDEEEEPLSEGLSEIQDEVEELPNFLQINTKKKSHLKRSSTYLRRKNEIINDAEDSSNSSNSNSEKNNYGLPKALQKCTSTPVSVLVNSQKEEVQKIEIEEKETAKLINKLVSAHQLKFSENDLKHNINIFQNVASITPRVRYLELHDIQLEEKNENELEQAEDITQSILNQFEAGCKTNNKNVYSSSIDQFLAENNLQRQNNLIKEKKKSQTDISKKANVSKQMTLDSHSSKRTEALTSPMKARGLTMKSEDTPNIFNCPN